MEDASPRQEFKLPCAVLSHWACQCAEQLSMTLSCFKDLDHRLLSTKNWAKMRCMHTERKMQLHSSLQCDTKCHILLSMVRSCLLGTFLTDNPCAFENSVQHMLCLPMLVEYPLSGDKSAGQPPRVNALYDRGDCGESCVLGGSTLFPMHFGLTTSSADGYYPHEQCLRRPLQCFLRVCNQLLAFRT